MLEVIFFYIATVIQNYIINYINEFFVKPKINRHIIVMVYSVALMICTILSTLARGVVINTWFTWIILFLLVWTLYYGSVQEKIMAYIEVNAILILFDTIITQITFGLLQLDTGIAQSYTFERSIWGLACSVIQLPFIYLIGKIQKKKKISLTKKQKKKIFLLLFVQAGVGWIYEFTFFLNNMYIGHIVFVFIIVSLTFDIYICRVMVMMEVKKETEQSIINMYEQNKMVMEYYEDLSNKMNNLSDLRETYENKMKQVYELAGKEYECKINIDEYKHVRCENTVVDSIITNVCIDLDRMNCIYDINMNIPHTVRMEAMDLASIFINMFDNALFAIERYIRKDGKRNKSRNKSVNKTPKFHLIAYADYSDGELIVEIKNIKSKSDKVRRLNDIFITTKENKEAHGYGMQIIKRIAEKYNGTMTVEYDDTSFINRVTLKV